MRSAPPGRPLPACPFPDARVMPPPPEQPRRLAFLGSPPVAVTALRALVEAGYDVAAVVTSAPKRRGRGAGLTPTPVGAAAEELGLAVMHDAAELQGAGLDLGVVVAYGRLLKAPLLAELALVNLHFSLLPRWRGAAPVERALLAGDAETGVCLMEVVKELDAGGVYRRASTPIAPHDTADTLRARLGALGTGLLLDALRGGFGIPNAQEGPSTYAEKITREDLHLDWAQPAATVHRVVRVGTAWTTVDGVELKVWDAVPVAEQSAGAPGSVTVRRHAPPTVACGAEALELRSVQPAGKARVDALAWAHGLHGPVVLGT